MKIKQVTLALSTAIALNFSSIALASPPVEPATSLNSTKAQTVHDHLLQIQQAWAVTHYRTKEKHKEAKFESLIDDIDELANSFPKAAEPKIWQGIIRATYAGTAGGLSALSLVKDARDYLEQAIKIDDKALNGSAYTSLASLYLKVPGWPIGFGDDDKAEELFEKAMKINPDGLDSNYFYAEYLMEEDDYDDAYAALTKALQAPVRTSRPIADKERRKELNQLLEQLSDKI